MQPIKTTTTTTTTINGSRILLIQEDEETSNKWKIHDERKHSIGVINTRLNGKAQLQGKICTFVLVMKQTRVEQVREQQIIKSTESIGDRSEADDQKERKHKRQTSVKINKAKRLWTTRSQRTYNSAALTKNKNTWKSNIPSEQYTAIWKTITVKEEFYGASNEQRRAQKKVKQVYRRINPTEKQCIWSKQNNTYNK